MRNLPSITLACIDTANHSLALRALALSQAGLAFARTLLLTDAIPDRVVVPPGIDVEHIARIRSRADYSRFVLKELRHFVSTEHVLLVQWDGYVVNPDAWDDAFLGADYIGAKWFWFDDGMRVGNGGFSLRSARLLHALADPRITPGDAEDITIGRTYRPLLEAEHRILFADEAMADRFAFEAAYPIGRPLGFHGLFNFCRVVAPTALALLVPTFSDAIASSPQCRSLLRNCIALSQWHVVASLALRMLAVTPGDAELTAALAQASAGTARGTGVGRNDPCPCGSGKRYKLCHGALAAPPISVTAPAPPSPEVLAGRGIEAHQRNDLDAAERNYRAALAMAPEHPIAMHYLGVVFYQRGQLAAALPLLERAVALVPAEPEFHNNHGLALAVSERLPEAMAAYRRALALKPGHAHAWNNLGLALQLAGEVPQAVEAFERALELQPDFAQAHWNLALALLLLGRFAEGWAEYEWRLRAPELKVHLRTYQGARWDGSDPAGKTLLVTAEQGLGDTLQNVRFARELSARGARIVAVVQPPLVSLVATAPGIVTACAIDDQLPAFDAHVSLMSLPGLLSVGAETVPAVVPYLRAMPSLVERARELMSAFSGQLNVGLSWSGAAGNSYNLRRTCPLTVFSPLLDTPGVQWYSLQKESEPVTPDDAKFLPRLVQLALRNDFDGTAALVDALDLVISVDTSHAHLAGALGKPVWILLPFAPDWRWMQRRDDTPWYPTARLFRQRTPGDWSAPLNEMQRALRSRIS